MNPLSITTKQFIKCLYLHKFSQHDLSHLLQSKHQNLVQIFQAIRSHPSYYVVAKKIIQSMLTNIYKMISEKLEVHIICNIWKAQFLDLLIANNMPSNSNKQAQMHNKKKQFDYPKATQILNKVFIFLCQKMRSLKFVTRISALNSFNDLLHEIICIYPSQNSSPKFQHMTLKYAQIYERILLRSLKPMLKKQQLVKVVSYNQGLFLQLLQDQYHQIRVKTLSILQFISLKTPFFYITQTPKFPSSTSSTSQPQNQTLTSLKQTILYMLNDQHQLVRQRSLVAIYRISQSNLHIKQQQVFNPLSKQQIFTILMCLKQNNMVLRQKVYECLKNLNQLFIDQLFLILQKLYQTLLFYKQDKFKIYLLLKQYSHTQKHLIQTYVKLQPRTNILQFYEYNFQEQPNCKNIVYKGKIILLKEIIRDYVKLGRQHYLYSVFPKYVVRHLSYVEDFEMKLKLAKYGIDEMVREEGNLGMEGEMEDYEKIQEEQIWSESLRIEYESNNVLKNAETLKRLHQFIQMQQKMVPENTFDYSFLNIMKQVISLLIDYIQQNYQQQITKYKTLSHKNPQQTEQSQSLHSFYEFIYQNLVKPIEKQRQTPRIVQKIDSLKFKIEEIKFVYNINYVLTFLGQQLTLKFGKIMEISRLLRTFESLFNFLRSQEIKNKDQISLQLQRQILSLKKLVLSYIKIATSNTKQDLILSTQPLLPTSLTFAFTPTTNLTLLPTKFKIRPITVGRSLIGQGYNDHILIMIQYPYCINLHTQYQFHSQNLWIKLITMKNKWSQQKNNFLQYSADRSFSQNQKSQGQWQVFYVKYEDLAIISDIRPLIDYNQKKTTFSAELPLKIVGAKFCDLFASSLRSIRNNKSPINPFSKSPLKPQLKNFQTYKSLIQKQIIIKDVFLIFSHNQQNKKTVSKKQENKIILQNEQKIENINFNFNQLQSNQIVLAEWHRFVISDDTAMN